jgi:hypothetical protein
MELVDDATNSKVQGQLRYETMWDRHSYLKPIVVLSWKDDTESLDVDVVMSTLSSLSEDHERWGMIHLGT